MERLATYQLMEQPVWVSGEPLPPIVRTPAMKSVGSVGIGNGLQRSGFGEAGPSSNRLVKAPSTMLVNSPCTAAGRMRYSQLRRLECRGAVKAVPENCSAYRP
jgi:hypothetical protein